MLHLHPEQTLINQLFDAQPDSVLWFTPLFSNNNDSIPNDFEVRYCNRKAAQFLNSTPEAVFGARLSNSPMMDEATRRRIFDQCLAVWMNSESMEFNYHSPGHDRYYNVQRSKVNGGVLSITRDRTQEMQAERAHALQEQRYRQILDTAADGILVFEAERVEGNIVDFQVTHANRRAFQIGALPPDAVGRSLLQLFPHLRGSEQFERHCRVVESGTPQQFETSFRRPDGSEYGWFIVSLTRLGEGLVSNFVDVTQRKKNEEKIQEQHHLLNRIFEASISGMFAATAIRDANGSVTDLRVNVINRSFTQQIGFSEERCVGSLYSDLFPTAMKNGLFDVFRDVIDRKMVVRRENHYQGEQLDSWFDFAATPLEPDGILVSFTDISERKQLQLELEQKLDELKRSNKSLEEFAYAASHDLQEPLRKIHFFSDRLKQSISPESDQADMFARMESATTRMRDLIDDLLAYSRLSVASEAFEEVALDDVVTQVLQDLEQSVEDSGALVQIDSLPVIHADERQMRQLFQNLLSNALKYRMEGRKPEVRVQYRICTDEECKAFQLPSELGGHLMIEVTDNGIGFEQQYADKIFQVFQRLHGRREYSGSGVGLAIARKVVLNHKGQLLAEGRPGEGATFRVFLPLSSVSAT